MLIAEAIRTAQQITGKKVVNGEDVRRGLEALNITEARLKELGLEGFAAPVKVVLRGPQRPSQGLSSPNGTAPNGSKASDWIEPMKDEVRPLLEAGAKEYAEKNTGWPKRSESCAKQS